MQSLGDLSMSDVLAGGWGQERPPEKVGETVHRQVSENSDFVHLLLGFLGKKAYTFAPRFLGMDEQGREVLEYIEGYVPHGQLVDPKTWSVETMTEIFCQIRRLHDLTTATELAGAEECVCHGDLSYANTVYRRGRAVAFIDWDWAHPGERVDDVAYALLQYLSIGGYFGDGPEGRAGIVRKLVDAYGLSDTETLSLVDRMLESILATRDKQLKFIEMRTPAGKRLEEAGVPSLMLQRYEWLERHKAIFEAALRQKSR
jgi:Phosphotransferase enzyme family